MQTLARSLRAVGRRMHIVCFLGLSAPLAKPFTAYARWKTRLGEPPEYVEGDEEKESPRPDKASKPDEDSEQIIQREVAEEIVEVELKAVEILPSIEEAFLEGYGVVRFTDNDGDRVLYAESNGKLLSYVNEDFEGVVSGLIFETVEGKLTDDFGTTILPGSETENIMKDLKKLSDEARVQITGWPL
mmetsp:Transcript_12718/g.17675  ORF Transcript_12718/g.17675 Transcript_12718/m.17675 type:complete len:187 (-) Transcript_12718:242-802(-)